MAANKRSPDQVINRDLTTIDTILKCISKAVKFSKYDSVTDFENDEMAFDACIRQMEVIGEAVKRLSNSLTEKHPEINWSDLAGMRDRLIHQYDKVDSMILWDTIKQELPLEVPKLLAIKDKLVLNRNILNPEAPKGHTPSLF